MLTRWLRAVPAIGFLVLSTNFVLLWPNSVNADADRVVTVMTRNVYHGIDAEIQAIFTATNFADLLQRVAVAYQGYFDRDFPQRAKALAAEIEAKRPHLIGLQEAVLVRTQTPPSPTTPATNVALDFVQILLDELASRGLRYEVVVQAANSDHELPSLIGDIRQTDREVILARADLPEFKVSNAQGGVFATNCTLPTSLLGNVTFLRGWVAVDVKLRGKSFRFINTHLDAACQPFAPAIQQAQAAELVAGPAATKLPVVLVGDLNSPHNVPGNTYSNLIGAGFLDAAAQAGIGNVPTCCQAPDLLNAASELDHRSDYILTRGGFSALSADIVGDAPADRTTPSGFWPSDHAGVVATLKHPQP